jgi:hypothetical protein
MRLDPDGWLSAERGGAQVVRFPTVRTTPLATVTPLGLVWHATGGVGGPRFAEGLARRIQTYRRGIDRPASWHVLISADGTIYQGAPFTVGTWHVGRPGLIAGAQRRNVNSVTIGVELENAGPLAQVQGAFYAWPYWLDRAHRKPDPRYRVSVTRVARVDGRTYDAFTPAQIAGTRELVSTLIRHAGWKREAFTYCHSDFASPWKTDPVALWKATLPSILDAAFDDAPPLGQPGEEITVVTGPPEFGPDDDLTQNGAPTATPHVRQAS